MLSYYKAIKERRQSLKIIIVSLFQGEKNSGYYSVLTTSLTHIFLSHIWDQNHHWNRETQRYRGRGRARKKRKSRKSKKLKAQDDRYIKSSWASVQHEGLSLWVHCSSKVRPLFFFKKRDDLHMSWMVEIFVRT